MDATLIKCPQCRAPLAPPSRFARSMVCPFCNATAMLDPSVVSTARFRKAYQDWSSPARFGFTHWVTLADGHWVPQERLASGEFADVLFADRARLLTERALLKVARDPADAARLQHEYNLLTDLHMRAAEASFTARLPRPIAHGTVQGDSYSGRPAIAFHWDPHFPRTLAQVHAAYPAGIPPQVAVWMWRRTLELLAFLHWGDVAHGAILPEHLLIEDGDHGVRVIGYGNADRFGKPWRINQARLREFYPAGQAMPVLTAAVDIAMSARCIAFALGGDSATGVVPGTVPAPLAELIRQIAQTPETVRDAWTLRDQVGAAGRAAFGAPAFHPLAM